MSISTVSYKITVVKVHPSGRKQVNTHTIFEGVLKRLGPFPFRQAGAIAEKLFEQIEELEEELR